MDAIDPASAAALELFREKFGRLRRSSVWHAIEENKVHFSLKAERGQPVQLVVEGPGEEAVDAFVLTLRFFLQNNEKISIGNLADLFDKLAVSEEAKDRVRVGRTSFNAFLDRNCGIQINGFHPTNREVIDIFVYGGLAHANPSKREVFVQWSRQSIVFGMMTQVFFGCLLEVLRYLAFFDTKPGRGRVCVVSLGQGTYVT